MIRTIGGTLGVLFLSCLIGIILAAEPITSPPSLNNIPPDPCQYHVHGTTTQIIFSHFSKPVRTVDGSKLNHIIARAQFEIVQSIVKNRPPGDGLIAQPNFDWHLGRLHIRINNPDLRLKWSVMSETLEGIRDWYPVMTEFGILDETGVLVGKGSIGEGY